MLKKICVSIFIILCVILFITNSYAVTPSIYVENVVKPEDSDEVTVNLYVENVDSNIASLGLNIDYDESKLEYVSSKHGKNLKATVQMSEYVEKNKIAIRIMSSSGLKSDGAYYQMTFRVLNNNIKRIPVNLGLKEATDTSGNNVQCNVRNGIIYTTDPGYPVEENKATSNTDNANSAKENDSEKEKTENNKTIIKPFEKTDIKTSETLNDIVESNTEVNTVKKDNLKYEVKDKDILEVLDNGSMIPKKDGITQVIVKQDNGEIGIMEVEVKNGEIKRITSQTNTENTEEKSESKTQNTTQEKEAKQSVTKGNDIDPVVLFIIVVLFGLIIMTVYTKIKSPKKSRKTKKKKNS